MADEARDRARAAVSRSRAVRADAPADAAATRAGRRPSPQPPAPLADGDYWMRPAAISAYTSLSRSTVGRAIRSGAFPSTKVSRARLAKRSSVDAWVGRLPTAALLLAYLYALLLAGCIAGVPGLCDLLRDIHACVL